MKSPLLRCALLAPMIVTLSAADTRAAASKKGPPMDPKPVIDACVKHHGAAHAARIERGVRQAAALWRKEDGDLTALCKAQFVGDEAQLQQTFARLEASFEQVDGHLLEIGRELRKPTDLDVGPLLPVDTLFSQLDVGAHLLDDLFASKVAFVALLNFPQSTLEQRLAQADKWSRLDWAIARLTNRFSRRIPAEVMQRAAETGAKADLYIAEYNLWMHHILDDKGQRVFPSGKRLISHWNLRDELKAQYANGAEGANRQRVIVKLMERIVTQAIPAIVIDNPHVDYNPFTGAVVAAPKESIEKDAPPAKKGSDKPASTREDDERYRHLLAQFEAQRAFDPHSPTAPNAVQRSFELQREIPEARVKQLFEEVLSSPLVPKVAAEIERRLGRKLEPQDLWYDGFKARSAIPEDKLDAMTKKRYPTADAFAKDMPRLLVELGFSKERAAFLASHILVDASRGAGHAMQAGRRGDFPHLRTRVEAGGMNYKGYNIAVHEMGHNVEQVFSLYHVDHTLLAGVPNNAFTEAIAFVFQARDIELLGMKPPAAEAAKAKREMVLNDFWMTWEIAGVALVDVAVWHWMYAHPKAKPAELRAATVKIAEEIWAKFYQPVLGATAGEKGSPLLGIYSHMIAYPLYLTDYPLGHLIAFQIEEQLERAHAQKKPLGAEIERMCVQGAIAPDAWMKGASGEPISAGPLLRATDKALAP